MKRIKILEYDEEFNSYKTYINKIALKKKNEINLQ